MVFRVGARFEFHSSVPLSHSSPSLIGLLAPVRCMLTGSVFWMRKINTVTPAVHARVRAHTLTHTLRVVNQCLEFHTHTHTHGRVRAARTHASPLKLRNADQPVSAAKCETMIHR